MPQTMLLAAAASPAAAAAAAAPSTPAAPHQHYIRCLSRPAVCAHPGCYLLLHAILNRLVQAVALDVTNQDFEEAYRGGCW
jgi:hypothetical protein